MVGPSLLITPVLHEGKATVTGYFPSSGRTTWRDWTTGEVSILIYHRKLQAMCAETQVVKPDGKGQAELLTPLGKINVHIRSGSVVLIHDKPAYSLTETRESPYGLVIHLDAKGEAKGEAVLDDGLSINGQSLFLTDECDAYDQALRHTSALQCPTRSSRSILTGSTSQLRVSPRSPYMGSPTNQWRSKVWSRRM
jgi:alpha-glucosidase (family GH31 glycosyl hydrolase)